MLLARFMRHYYSSCQNATSQLQLSKAAESFATCVFTQGAPATRSVYLYLYTVVQQYNKAISTGQEAPEKIATASSFGCANGSAEG